MGLFVASCGRGETTATDISASPAEIPAAKTTPAAAPTNCTSDVRAYEFGREMATMVELGSASLSSAISEFGIGLGIAPPYSADNPCVKCGYNDAMQGKESPYNKDGRSWNSF